jgi:hypothetical protein
MARKLTASFLTTSGDWSIVQPFSPSTTVRKVDEKFAGAAIVVHLFGDRAGLTEGIHDGMKFR